MFLLVDFGFFIIGGVVLFLSWALRRSLKLGGMEHIKCAYAGRPCKKRTTLLVISIRTWQNDTDEVIQRGVRFSGPAHLRCFRCAAVFVKP